MFLSIVLFFESLICNINLAADFTGSAKSGDAQAKIPEKKVGSFAISKKDDKKATLIVNVDASKLSRKVIASDESILSNQGKRSSLEKIVPKTATAKKKDPNLMLFVNTKKKTVKMNNLKFDEVKTKSWSHKKTIELKVSLQFSSLNNLSDIFCC